MKKEFQPNELNYVRIAYKAKDGHDGFLYLHSWGTGIQALIFGSHEAADRFIEKDNQRKRELCEKEIKH